MDFKRPALRFCLLKRLLLLVGIEDVIECGRFCFLLDLKMYKGFRLGVRDLTLSNDVVAE